LRKHSALFLFVCGAGAELAWLYAWASFLLISLFHRLYPLPEAVGTFSLAAFLTHLHYRRSRRAIQIVGLHLSGMACAGLWVVHEFYYRTEPFWERDWLIDFFNRPRSGLEWILLIFILSYTVFFWAAGAWIALQKKSYLSACTRFDRGIAAFFCLFLIKLLLHTQMGVQFRDSMTVWLIFPFFIFGLTEIGLARNRHGLYQKSYLAGYYTAGVLTAFAVGALILGSAVFLLFLPYLKAASEAGYGLMKSAAAPLSPYLIALIKFIFGHANFAPQNQGTSAAAGTAGAAGTQEPDAWLLVVQKIVLWGGGALMLMLAAVAVGLALWYTVRWLLMKRYGENEERGYGELFLWWRRIKSRLLAVYEWLMRTGAKRSARDFYAALLRWGRSAGTPQTPGGTPLEYGRQLAVRFPQLQSEIMVIIEMLHREVYGEAPLSPSQILKIQQAWKTLHRPFKRPFRIKYMLNS
jgi:hypothetical protein